MQILNLSHYFAMYICNTQTANIFSCAIFIIYLKYVITIICLIRCDQYRWVHKGTYPIKHDSGIVMKKKSSTIDVPSDNSSKGDDRFRKFEYWGIGSYFLVHYVGDCTVFEGFCHRNSKSTSKPFVRSAPHVKEKVSILIMYMYVITYVLNIT